MKPLSGKGTIQATDGPLLLKVPDAAAALGLSPRRLYALAAIPGALPDGLVVRLGRSVRLSRPVLLWWLHAERSGQDDRS